MLIKDNFVIVLYFREKQEARDHMIGYLGSLQKRAEADYDTQIFRAQAQREEKELREEKEKLEKRQKMHASIEKHRQETVRTSFNCNLNETEINFFFLFKIKRRDIEKDMQQREDNEMRQRKDEADQLFNLYQQEKYKKRAQDAQMLSECHLRQAVSH